MQSFKIEFNEQEYVDRKTVTLAVKKAHMDKAIVATEAAIARASELKQTGLSLQKVAGMLNIKGFTISHRIRWSKQALSKRVQ